MKNPQIIILILIAVIAVAFGVKQKAVVKKQQAEISALILKQDNDERQFLQLAEEKKNVESRFNETLNQLKQITQTKMTLDFQLEKAQKLIDTLGKEKKSFDSSVQMINTSNAAVPSRAGAATLQGKLLYWNKSITWVTNEKPVIEVKNIETGNPHGNAKILFKGSKYVIENLPLGKYAVSVSVKVPYKKDRHIPEELKGKVNVEVLKAGKTVDQDITLQ